MNNQPPEQRAAELNCYLVGGAVRDRLLNVARSDRDWVVVGATESHMRQLGFRPIGREFPVFLHPETHEEYALARRERKVGRGYKGFEFDVSSDVTLEQDLYRRDLTINAMALDSDGKLIDPFGGQKDLENGLLRHVSAHFCEDPLRVLRVARFAARYYRRGFIVDTSTLELMGSLAESDELDHLVAERVWQEVLGALSEDHPAVFFSVLRVCGALKKLFPEIDRLFECENPNVPALMPLESAALLTDDIEIRFSVLAYLFNRSAAESTDDSLSAIPVNKFCRRFRTSAKIRTLAMQVARFADWVYNIKKRPAVDVVEMILALNGLRNSRQFKRFSNACSVVLNVIHQDESQVRLAIALLCECCGSMRQVDAKTLAKRFRGEELRNKVRDAHIAAVSKRLEKKETKPPTE